MRYWLMKSEPDEFSIDDLYLRPRMTEHWDGVRNYQARNMMRDEMKIGDQAFFYQSNCASPGIVGIMRITREGYPDHSAFDPDDKHYDPKTAQNAPRWFMVDVTFERKLSRCIGLHELKTHSELAELVLLKRGNRLSIMPITQPQWNYILTLE